MKFRCMADDQQKVMIDKECNVLLTRGICGCPVETTPIGTANATQAGTGWSIILVKYRCNATHFTLVYC